MLQLRGDTSVYRHSTIQIQYFISRSQSNYLSRVPLERVFRFERAFSSGLTFVARPMVERLRKQSTRVAEVSIWGDHSQSARWADGE